MPATQALYTAPTTEDKNRTPPRGTSVRRPQTELQTPLAQVARDRQPKCKQLCEGRPIHKMLCLDTPAASLTRVCIPSPTCPAGVVKRPVKSTLSICQIRSMGGWSGWLWYKSCESHSLFAIFSDLHCTRRPPSSLGPSSARSATYQV